MAFRAPVDNERQTQPNRIKPGERDWRLAGLDNMSRQLLTCDVIEKPTTAPNSDCKIKVATRYTGNDAKGNKTGAGFVHTALYAISPSGQVHVANTIEPFGCDKVPFFGRIGVDFIVQPRFTLFKWYGRGPHENYIDRKESADIGIYTGSVDQQFEPYARPQACGNKENVRRLWLLDEKGRGLCVNAASELSATALHYTTRQLDEAWRLDELKPIEQVVLSLDYAQHGLGNGSCGTAITMDKYQLKRMDAYKFAFTLEPTR